MSLPTILLPMIPGIWNIFFYFNFTSSLAARTIVTLGANTTIFTTYMLLVPVVTTASVLIFAENSPPITFVQTSSSSKSLPVPPALALTIVTSTVVARGLMMRWLWGLIRQRRWRHSPRTIIVGRTIFPVMILTIHRDRATPLRVMRFIQVWNRRRTLHRRRRWLPRAMRRRGWLRIGRRAIQRSFWRQQERK